MKQMMVKLKLKLLVVKHRLIHSRQFPMHSRRWHYFGRAVDYCRKDKMSYWNMEQLRFECLIEEKPRC